jgi:prepilin-type N-terminal cleavage/methylation domain-containing protein
MSLWPAAKKPIHRDRHLAETKVATSVAAQTDCAADLCQLTWVDNGRRRGFSLMEMMAATAVMAVIMTSAIVVIRSGYAVWTAYEQDVDIAENAYGVLRHFIRQMRQATAVTAISAASDTTGDLSFTTAGGVTQSWSLNGGTSQVAFNNGTTSNTLAKWINQLVFVGYQADGVTATTVVDDIQVVKCTVQVTMTQGGTSTRTVSAKAWIRSW